MNSSKKPDQQKPGAQDQASQATEQEILEERIRQANYEINHGLPNTTGLRTYRTHRTIVKKQSGEGKPKRDASC